MSTILKLVAEFIPNPTEGEINEAMPTALLKRDRIIQREGDAGGTRMLLDYLAQLIAEQIRNDRAERFCISDYEHKKRHVAEANVPEQHNNHKAISEFCQVININLICEVSL